MALTWTTSAAVLVLLSAQLMSVHSLELGNCTHALGMEYGQIPDSALSASSEFDSTTGAASSRVRKEHLAGAWCPKPPITEGVYEYLQIDLGELKVITMVETQGRFGRGQGQQYVEQFNLEYQREDDGRWFRFRNRRNQEILQGNINTYATEMRKVDPPIIARRIRFVPYSTHPRDVCLRVEIFGCSFEDHMVSYDMPQGQTRGDIDLIDYTYDGDMKDAFLSGGMGQLTDGVAGESNFRLAHPGLGVKGYDWVGWKNETASENRPVEIVFKFDSVRNFTTLKIQTNNMFKQSVSVFRTAVVHFSIGGKFYQEEPVVFHYARDEVIEYARAPVIQMGHKVGRYVKVALFFEAKWLMISEVEFTSTRANGEHRVEVAPIPGRPFVNTIHVDSPRESTPKYTINDQPPPREVDIRPKDGRNGGSGKDLSHKPPKKVDQNETKSVNNPTANQSNSNDGVIGIIIGVLAVLIVLSIIIFIFVFLRRRRKYKGHEPVKIGHELPYHFNEDEFFFADSHKKSVNVYNFVNGSDGESEKDTVSTGLPNGDSTCVTRLLQRQLPELPPTPLSTGRRTPRPYATSTLPSIQGVSGTNVYAAPHSLTMVWRNHLTAPEISRDKLRFVENLGEGQFGEVQLCEVLGVSDLLGDDFLINRTSGKPLLVAVKTLRSDATEAARRDFHKEVQLMCQLKDPNIVQVLGVCTKDEPLSVIVEYMKHGDLHQFLLQHEPEMTVNTLRRPNINTLSTGSLAYMGTQIASGMAYLESLNMIHRDLAARNCLVGHKFTIKISDFGMSRTLYSSDYYKIEGKAVLPIRWMAWESVLLGKFSSKSDVWSFGVTMWEMLNFARTQPFEELTDEQVIENCGHFFRQNGVGRVLDPPPACPKELYDLMCECWNVEESFRPSFREIHMFLQKKSSGYNPLEEINSTASVPQSYQ